MVFRAIFDKIKPGLTKTRSLFSGIASLFRLRGRVDKDFLDELESRLYLADVGTVATTADRRPRPPGLPRQGNHRRRRGVRQAAARATS